MFKSPALKITSIALLLIVVCVPLFYNLGKFQIRMWDEARYANNAVEMFLDKDLIVLKHNGETDLYSTKPPFVIWMQAISMCIFGVNEFAVRFPSALFGLLTVALIFWFSVGVLNSKIIGFISSLVLITSKGFVCHHVTRTGDLDSVLVFGLTFYSLLFLKLLLQPTNKLKLHFILIGSGISIAFLSKGVAGFFFLPFLTLIYFLYGNYKGVLKNKKFYLSIIIAGAICVGYYLLRELRAPGYLKTVFHSEISRISDDGVMVWQLHPFNFYLTNMKNSRFYPFFYLLPFTFITLFLTRKNSTTFKAFIYLAIIAIGFFFLISYPGVKMEYYDAPVYPILALLIGIFINSLFIKLKDFTSAKWDPSSSYILLAAIVVMGFWTPYKKILEGFSYPESYIYDMEMEGAYMKRIKVTYPAVKKYTVIKTVGEPGEHYDEILFYKRAYKYSDNFDVSITASDELKSGEVIMTCQQEHIDTIEKKYNYDVIDKWNKNILYKITGKKM
jgi:4-amino-4-deoxy-L-arabinose transferase-like glycosyltransferase